MFDILSTIKMVAAPLTSVVTGWQKRKTAKLDSDLAIASAKTAANIKKIETGQVADIAWEKTSLEQSGWKDEYWTIVLSIPMIMCFVPGLVQYVEKGFAALQSTPEWYRYVVGVAIGSAFGVRQVANFMALKKGS
jgi:hypothetical protein